MQQAHQRSNLVPSGFVVESAYFEGDKAVIAVRASASVGLCPSCGTVSRRVHSRITRLHDLVSGLFGIRARFDRANILLPLAIMSGAKMSARQVANIKRDRSHLMRDTFYK
jgi:hypothetical protein